jgi:hypothetical protein
MNEELGEAEMLRRLKAEEAIPDTPTDLSARVWAEISPRLKPYNQTSHSWWMPVWNKPLWALAVGLLVVLSFVGGRVWEKTFRPLPLPQTTAERILLTAAADHLERSQRFLVELQMSRRSSPQLVQTARELLDDNRLYRQSALWANDRTMADVLDRLGRVLAEVAYGEQSDDAASGLAQGNWQLDDLARAIRAEQRRSPLRA